MTASATATWSDDRIGDDHTKHSNISDDHAGGSLIFAFRAWVSPAAWPLIPRPTETICETSFSTSDIW
jgi:hypothetical protein